jgi:glycerol kinase
MPPAILALDQGTTSSRAIVFAEDGRVLGVAQKELRQHFPRPGWVEHDPLEIWRDQHAAARDALRAAGLTAGDVAGIGITNQRETTMLWDRASGEPIHRAIVWQDRRTARMVDRLREEGWEDAVRDRTGLVLDPYFSATKIAWLLENVKGARAKAEAGRLAFGTVDTWLAWNLSGGAVHATDPSNASRTMLFDIRRLDWDEELLDALRIPRSILPEVRPSSGVWGSSAADVLGAPVPIAGVAGDQQAATFGQACFARGQSKNTYGTGCFLVLNTGTDAVKSEHRLLATVGWRLGDEDAAYALEGSVFIGGAVVQWLRDGLGLIERSGDVEALASSVEDSGGVYVVPAFAGLGAPHWDPYARGAIVGLTRGTTAAHVARAALEAIAFQVADVAEAMERDAGVRLDELRVDGGAASNDLLLQTQADLLGIPVVRPAVTETTALGAAWLAGLAVGTWTQDDLAATWREERRFEPAAPEDFRERALSGWRKAVERAKAWAEE